MKMRKVLPFEQFARRYDDWFVKNKLVYESELKALRVTLPTGGKGVEIGVGTGRFATNLGIRVGLDPSKEMSRIAKKRGVEVIEGVAEALPFKDHTFDFAMMVTTICFLNDIVTSFKEAHRILASGGRLIVGFIDRGSRLGLKYQKEKTENVFYKDANFYSVDEVVSNLSKAGFSKFVFAQTIFKNLGEITETEPAREGFGEGSFVVVSAEK